MNRLAGLSKSEFFSVTHCLCEKASLLCFPSSPMLTDFLHCDAVALEQPPICSKESSCSHSKTTQACTSKITWHKPAQHKSKQHGVVISDQRERIGYRDSHCHNSNPPPGPDQTPPPPQYVPSLPPFHISSPFGGPCKAYMLQCTLAFHFCCQAVTGLPASTTIACTVTACFTTFVTAPAFMQNCAIPLPVSPTD